MTGNAFIDGPESNIPNINFNPTGGVVHLDVTLRPDGLMGTWEISQTLHFYRNGTVSSNGVGHGTGDLQGMIIKFTAGDAVVVDNPCADAPSAPIMGVIISP